MLSTSSSPGVNAPDCASRGRQRATLPWKWHCVETHWQLESLACRHLEVMGFTTHLPTFLAMKGRGRKQAEVSKPLFPGYIFVLFDPWNDPWQRIVTAMGIKQILRNADGYPIALNANAMQLARLDRPAEALPPRYKKGDEVTVTEGSLRLFQGIVQLSTKDRVHVFLNVFGRNIPVELAINDVVRTNK